MNTTSENLNEWCKKAENIQNPTWTDFPDIDLYMDQIITYTEKQLNLFERDKNSPLLSSSMVNNYTKDGVLPRPNKKKYNKNHLALIYIICIMKQVLSLQDIHFLIYNLMQNMSEEKLYTDFCECQHESMQNVSSYVDSAIKADNQEELIKLSVELAIKSNSFKTASERIITELLKLQEKTDKK